MPGPRGTPNDWVHRHASFSSCILTRLEHGVGKLKNSMVSQCRTSKYLTLDFVFDVLFLPFIESWRSPIPLKLATFLKCLQSTSKRPFRTSSSCHSDPRAESLVHKKHCFGYLRRT